MKNRIFIVSLAALLLGVTASYFYHRAGGRGQAARESALAMMPADAVAIVFADVTALRSSAFVAQLYAWAPRPTIDPEYAQFLRDTAFDYERDLNRIAIAVIKHAQDTALFAVADGRFDRQKITAYASRSGQRETFGGREIFSVPLSGNSHKMSFTFLGDDRIALTDGAGLAPLLAARPKGRDANDWHERFVRLAGSPTFAVIRQDAATRAALASRAPGGFQSPQLAALLDQLQWISIAGRPEGDRLRVVTEGECAADGTARQLADLLSGVLVLAQAGLNGPDTRKGLDPQAREAYLEMLQGAEVSRLDHNETKSVRLMFDITPKFLEAPKSAIPALPSAASSTPPANASPKPSQEQPKHHH